MHTRKLILTEDKINKFLVNTRGKSRIMGKLGEVFAYEYFVRYRHFKPYNPGLHGYNKDYDKEFFGNKLDDYEKFRNRDHLDWLPDFIMKKDDKIYLIEVKCNTGIYRIQDSGMKRARELGFKTLIFNITVSIDFEKHSQNYLM